MNPTFAFLVKLVLAFVAGLVIGNALLHAGDVLVGLDPFDVRWGRWG
jgi:hypothetical protein